MPGWLVKAKNALGPIPDPEPQPYAVTCVCGRPVEGLRSDRYQEVHCEECGESLFVLPRDVYPRLRSNKKQTRKRGPQSTPSSGSPAESKPNAEAGSDVQTECAPEAAAGSSSALLSASERRKPRFTPFRVVMAMMVVVVSVTIYWAVHVRSLDRASVTAQRERDAGDAAVDAGDFAAAAAHYRIACEAIQTLGRNDAWARETCQLARETRAAARLAVRPLADILVEAHESLSSARTDAERTAAEEHALDLYRGQWIVMETTLLRDVSGDDGGWEIDYPFFIDSREVLIEAELPIFEELPSSETSMRVVFAAQLERCRLIEERRPSLVLELNPETAFLWTNYEILQAIGFAPSVETLGPGESAEDSIRSLLAQQSRIVGIEP